MRFEPHNYQRYAVDYMLDHDIAAIWLDCGLGKTVIALTALYEMLFDRFEIKKALVIAPLKTCRNSWEAEARKWDHLWGLKVSVAVGTAKQRLAALKEPADVYVINRENTAWLCEQSGIDFDYDVLVLDEASSFKSRQSKRFKAIMKVRPRVKRVYELTASPCSNSLMDLYSQIKILDYGERLYRYIGQYRSRWFIPERTNGPIVYSWKPLPGAFEEITNRLSDITVSMSADDYLDMPELISSEYPVRLSESEKKKYDDLKRDLVLNLPDGDVTAQGAGSLFGKLAQAAGGAVYSDDGSILHLHDEKLDALSEVLEASGPTVVCYWYKHELARIEERLKKDGIRYRRADSDESLRMWNAKDPAANVLLLHPASGGMGLNLQAGGNHMVFFSVPTSLELYFQTVRRLLRQGQEADRVIVQHIIAKGTIDERIMKMLEKKDMTQAAIVNAVRADLGTEE